MNSLDASHKNAVKKRNCNELSNSKKHIQNGMTSKRWRSTWNATKTKYPFKCIVIYSYVLCKTMLLSIFTFDMKILRQDWSSLWVFWTYTISNTLPPKEKFSCSLLILHPSKSQTENYSPQANRDRKGSMI